MVIDQHGRKASMVADQHSRRPTYNTILDMGASPAWP